MYHNTTDSAGAELQAFRAKAKTQQELVLMLFKRDPLSDYTASEAYAVLKRFRWISEATPLTSIRRAITDLVGEGGLEKTNQQRKGPFKRPEYVYRLADGQRKLF